MTTTNRRYDIDWIRVIAIGLLLLYHVAICFQPWGIMIGFITNKTIWDGLWIPMTMLNVWRIPLLFFVSGMGVYFALQNRDLKGLLVERSMRVLFPFIFGIILIVPIHHYIWQTHYHFDRTYSPDPGHLWFLGHIFTFVLILSPAFYFLKKNNGGLLATSLKKIFSGPVAIVLMITFFAGEALLINPRPYELYATTLHGYVLGFLAFTFGFCFMLAGSSFWSTLLKWRFVLLAAAVILFAIRISHFKQFAPNYLISIESNFWVLSVLAFGYKHLNRPGAALSYLSEAAYPVYILHMVFLYLGAFVIFRLDLNVQMQFVLLLLFTFAGCFAAYEFLVRRINFIRPLFGLKLKKESVVPAAVKCA